MGTNAAVKFSLKCGFSLAAIMVLMTSIAFYNVTDKMRQRVDTIETIISLKAEIQSVVEKLNNPSVSYNSINSNEIIKSNILQPIEIAYNLNSFNIKENIMQVRQDLFYENRKIQIKNGKITEDEEEI
jgi:hypothetical protein